MKPFRNPFAEVLSYLSLVALLASVAGCATGLARLALEEQRCGSWVVCTPEEALIASIEALRTHGDSLRLDCGTDRVRSEVLAQSCHERVRKVVHRFASEPAIEPITDGAVHVDVGEACIDTFTSGNEASDCAYFSYTVKLPLGWR